MDSRLAAVQALLLAGCALPAACTASQVQPLHLLSTEAPPYVQAGPDGRTSGVAVELVAALFARMQTPQDVRLYPLARALALVSHGDADGMFVLRKTPERAARYAFSAQPLLRQELVLFVRKESGIRYDGKLASLSGHSIGLVRGETYGAAFDAAVARGRLARIDYAAREEASFRKLAAGRIDMVVSDKESGWAALRKLGAEHRVRLAGAPLEISQGYLMFNRRRVDPGFMHRIDDTMAHMRKDGSARRIRNKYGLR